MGSPSEALGHTNEGLTGSEIGFLLELCKIEDIDPDLTKRHRVYNAFAHSQNTRKHRRNILDPDVLKFCREELVADNYFHAVLEAVKSIADKLRVRTGLTRN
jgi:hypothetical protein